MSVHLVVSLPTLATFPFELLVSTFLIIAAKDRLLGAELVLEVSVIVPPGHTLNVGVVYTASNLTFLLKLPPPSTTAASAKVNSVNSCSC
jgi:hypothetical protein